MLLPSPGNDHLYATILPSSVELLASNEHSFGYLSPTQFAVKFATGGRSTFTVTVLDFVDVPFASVTVTVTEYVPAAA